MRDGNGNYFDMSKYVGCDFYTHPMRELSDEDIGACGHWYDVAIFGQSELRKVVRRAIIAAAKGGQQ